jgi:hypothetical protein
MGLLQPRDHDPANRASRRLRGLDAHCPTQPANGGFIPSGWPRVLEPINKTILIRR